MARLTAVGIEDAEELTLRIVVGIEPQPILKQCPY